MAAYGLAVVAAMALGVARRTRDPAGMLARTLAVASILPVVFVYGLSALPLGQGPTLALLAAAAVAGGAVLLQMVRLTPTTMR